MEQTRHLGRRSAERPATQCAQHQTVMTFQYADAQYGAYLFLQYWLIGLRDIAVFIKRVVPVFGVVIE